MGSFGSSMDDSSAREEASHHGHLQVGRKVQSAPFERLHPWSTSPSSIDHLLVMMLKKLSFQETQDALLMTTYRLIPTVR